MNVQLFEKKVEYYSSKEMMALEDSREELRHNFFNSSEHYGGIVIITKIFRVRSVEGTDVILDIECNDSNYKFYFTHDIPIIRTTFPDIINSLPKYNLKYFWSKGYSNSKNIEFDTSFYTPDIYESNTIIVSIEIDDGTEDEEANRNDDECVYITKYVIGQEHDQEHDHDDYDAYDDDYDAYDDDHDDGYTKAESKTLRIIDESSINNINEVKANSNIYTGKSKVLTIAYPSSNPLVYIKAGMETSPSTPYLWYEWKALGLADDYKKSILSITRSDTQELDEDEGRVW